MLNGGATGHRHQWLVHQQRKQAVTLREKEDTLRSMAKRERREHLQDIENENESKRWCGRSLLRRPKRLAA